MDDFYIGHSGAIHWVKVWTYGGTYDSVALD